MKKLLIATVTMLAVTITAFAADGSKTVNYWIMEKFNSSYKAATDITWNVTPEFAKARFLLDGERVEAYYTPDGNFIGESRGISPQDLPKQARRNLKKYDGYTVKEVIEFTTVDNIEYYISLENEKEVLVLKINTLGELSIFKTTTK